MSPRVLGILCALAVPLLGGCSEGDVIRVHVPGGACEQPPDPAWRIVRPLCGARTQADAVWVTPDLAVIVGSGGLGLRWDGAQWAGETTGTTAALRSVAADSAGTVCAVGDGGAVVLREGDVWRTVAGAGTADLLRVEADARSFWMIGADGALRVLRDGSLAARTPAGAQGLRGLCAAGDSVWVTTGAGALLAGGDGGWRTDTPARLQGVAPVREVARLPDGRLVVLADSLYVRADAAWTTVLPAFFAVSGAVRDLRLRQRGGALWLDGRAYPRALLWEEEGAWRAATVWSHGVLAPLDRGRFLDVGATSIVWRDESPRVDPAGGTVQWRLLRCDDGTCLAAAREYGLASVTAEGLRPLVATDPGSRGRLGGAMAGASPEDFYVADVRDIWRFRSGSAELVAAEAMPGPIRDLAVRPDGEVVVLDYGGDVGIWTGDGMRLALPDTAGRLVSVDLVARRADGAVLLAAYDELHVVLGDSLLSLGRLGRRVRGGFLPDGRVLGIVGDGHARGSSDGIGWELVLWNPPETAAISLWQDPSPDCASLLVAGTAATTTSLHAWTSSASLVFRLAGDPAFHDWELVAGPLDREIEDLVVQPDGSLVAVTDDRLYWHPGAGP